MKKKKKIDNNYNGRFYSNVCAACSFEFNSDPSTKCALTTPLPGSTETHFLHAPDTEPGLYDEEGWLKSTTGRNLGGQASGGITVNDVNEKEWRQNFHMSSIPCRLE